MFTCLLRGRSTPEIRAIFSPWYLQSVYNLAWPSSRSRFLKFKIANLKFLIYPCLCLCFAFSQITRTTPLRCTTLHLSQIFLTEALTFMIFSSTFLADRLLMTRSPYDSTNLFDYL